MDAISPKCLLVAAAVALALAAPACTWDDLEPAPNQAPVIEGVLLDGEEVTEPVVREGSHIVFQVDVWDPNGDSFGTDQISWSVSDGELESESGPSVVWTAPYLGADSPSGDATVLVTVEVFDGKERVSKSTEVRVVAACSSDNQPPIIRSITADPDSIALGETTVITADVTDPEGDPIKFKWTVPFGYFEGNGPKITWVTTETCCRDWYTIQLVVTDGCTSVWGSTKVEVIP